MAVFHFAIRVIQRNNGATMTRLSPYLSLRRLHPLPHRCAMWLASLGLILSCLHVAAAYRPPDMEREIFDTKQISLNKFDRAGLVGALVSIARDFDEEENQVVYDTRSYALAIAGRLDQNSTKVNDCLEQLSSSGRTVQEDGADISRTSSRLYSGIRSLIRKKDNKANQTCAAYCVSIALTFDPDGEKADKLEALQKSLSEAGFKANWKGLLKSAIHHNNNPLFPGQGQFTKVERTMPGGSAEQFARKQTRITGLSVRRLQSGKHAGAALPIRITALREEDQDDILFKFDQKVGPLMAGSLDEVIKFMRVRYEKDTIPDGYTVDITMGDKGLVDGPSAGTAFALAIDTLFTGEEIDEQYACTGTMTSDGESGVIGGVAGKIRGAIHKDCRIVGVPHGNAKGVNDAFLLDGMDSLLNINVFTQKNFDDAYKLSRKSKSADIVTAMEIYQQVADLVKENGRDRLKNPEIQKKLQSVLDHTPNHLCAKLLLDWSKGQHVKILSLRGSLDELDTEMSAFGRSISKESKETAIESVAHLEKIGPILDKRMQPYHDAALTLCKAIKGGANAGEQASDFAKRIGNLFRMASSARGKILGNPEIVEEMGT